MSDFSYLNMHIHATDAAPGFDLAALSTSPVQILLFCFTFTLLHVCLRSLHANCLLPRRCAEERKVSSRQHKIFP